MSESEALEVSSVKAWGVCPEVDASFAEGLSMIASLSIQSASTETPCREFSEGSTQGQPKYVEDALICRA